MIQVSTRKHDLNVSYLYDKFDVVADKVVPVDATPVATPVVDPDGPVATPVITVSDKVGDKVVSDPKA